MQIAVAMPVALSVVMSIHSEDVRVIGDLLKDFQLPVLVSFILVDSLDGDCLVGK